MAFIIDNYNKYDRWDRAHSKYIFEINGNWYAIKEVELEWGKPKLPMRIGQYESQYYVYGTYNEAISFVQRMKRMN